MSEQENPILHIISNETKSSIDQLKVVTPSVYASIFTKYAKEHDQEIENEPQLASNLLNLECTNLTNMQDTTAKSAEKLSNQTQNAISAILKKDDVVLSKVLEETKALKDEIEKLKEAVYKDELTHAFNRKWLHDNFISKDEEATFTHDGTLMIIDLNYFKQINDIHGHIIGDKVLVYVTNALKKSHNKVIRYGGDEFIILFDKETSLNKALDILNNIREDILSKTLKSTVGTFRVSFSFGGITFKKGDSLAQVVENADKNMYHDKLQIKKKVKGI